MSATTHEYATYEQRRLLLQLSDHLTTKDSKKIVYLEELPKQLEDKEPWEVLAQLQVRGKATSDELVRILKVIGRDDVAKKAKELSKSKKTTVTRKHSGPSALKLDESVQLTLRNCDVLIEQMGYLEVAAEKGGKKRIQEVVAEANTKLQDHVQRKLKYVSGLLSSESRTDNEVKAPVVVTVNSSNGSSSPPSSPESSLTTPEWSVPRSPTHPRAVINTSELKKVAERLKSPSVHGTRGSGSSPRALRQNATSHVTAKHPLSSPQSSTVQNKATVSTLTTRPVQAIDTCEDEDIYTLPGPPMSKALTAKNEVEYYNIPPSKNQPPCTNRAENQLTAAGATSLVTGSSSKSVKATSSKKPAITPKPTNKGNQARREGSTTLIADDSTADTSGGDSGFSDSKAFRKEEVPLNLPQDVPVSARVECAAESRAMYAPLIKTQVKGPDYYKTLHRDIVEDVVYDDNR